MDRKRIDRGWSPLLLFFGVVLVDFWALAPLVTSYLSGAFPESPGEWGDLFGSVNALFSVFALLGVVYAIVIQRQELALQREELQASREQLQQSVSEQRQQTRYLADSLAVAEREFLHQDAIAKANLQPLWIDGGSNFSHNGWHVDIRNVGNHIRDAAVYSEKGRELSKSRDWLPNETRVFNFLACNERTHYLEIHYSLLDGTEKFTYLRCPHMERRFEIIGEDQWRSEVAASDPDAETQ